MRLETLNIIARNLRTLRTFKAISQVRMATDLGLSKVTYANYENGKSTPDAEFLYKVAITYGIDMNILFEENPNNFLLGISKCEFYDKDAKVFLSYYQKLSAFSRGMLVEYCINLIERDNLISVNRATLEARYKRKK